MKHNFLKIRISVRILFGQAYEDEQPDKCHHALCHGDDGFLDDERFSFFRHTDTSANTFVEELVADAIY